MKPDRVSYKVPAPPVVTAHAGDTHTTVTSRSETSEAEKLGRCIPQSEAS
jgi:hypothetical protein